MNAHVKTEFKSNTNLSSGRSLSLSATTIVKTLVAFGDLLALLVAVFITYLALYSSHPIKANHHELFLASSALYMFLTLVGFYFGNLYKMEYIYDWQKSFPKIILLSTIVFMALLAFAFALKISSSFSRIWVFSIFISSLGSIFLTRVIARQFLIYSAKQGKITKNIAIIGASDQGGLMVEWLMKKQPPWVKLIGVFDDRYEIKSSEKIPDRVSSSISDDLRFGNIEALITLSRLGQIDEILIAIPWSAEARILEILEKLKVLPVNIRLCPESLCFHIPLHGFGHYNGIPVLNVVKKPLSGWHFVTKYVEDMMLSLLIIILISPVMLAIAILIKLDSPGPVLFRQKRYGFNNQLINVFKFRSMYTDKQDDNAKVLTTRNDPRITKLGRFLRKTSLDELPQFFNVLTGEMSIVGPRPHATEAKAAGKLYENVVCQYAARHRVKPGITGWAQVNGWRGDTDTEEKIRKRVEYDIEYITKWSLIFDLLIIFRTVFIVLKDENAY